MSDKPRIMIVDDDDYMRLEVVGLLTTSLKVECRQFPSAIDAMYAVAEFEPDLIITDFRMPHMNGITFIQVMVARGFEKPIIMMSGDPMEEDALEAGAVAFFSKSHDLALLLEKVQSYLPH